MPLKLRWWWHLEDSVSEYDSTEQVVFEYDPTHTRYQPQLVTEDISELKVSKVTPPYVITAVNFYKLQTCGGGGGQACDSCCFGTTLTAGKMV